ncbi:unnamed protein product [Vitrella brassicaformis CCMP3155]|uniref:Uncharacterized protein n=1 Tax=Vitrella brassicaformis (strain CCMP3155) TaxID=1169540 RepID=A0A0G4EQQ4_VITBC|nr:unnamed protein product [Vitrella brassicaformis CCMP3155]|eukprot:CEM00558.1 unnamed protein product [Vitrella brassicaformis CCMP3155]
MAPDGTWERIDRQPPLNESWPSWEFLLEEERQEWEQYVNSVLVKEGKEPVSLRRRLTKTEELSFKVRRMREMTEEELWIEAPPKMLPMLWIVRPMQGNFCEGMKNDTNMVNSFVRKVREKWGPEQLQIVNVTVETNLPLLEIYAVGPWHTKTQNLLILHVRGNTLQTYLPWNLQHHPPEMEDKRLHEFYGGPAFVGGYPKWDEDLMVEELAACMNQNMTRIHKYEVPDDFLHEWTWEPINFGIRQDMLERLHDPTREKVQYAFTQLNITDYAEVLRQQIKLLDMDDEDMRQRTAEAERIQRDITHYGYHHGIHD